MLVERDRAGEGPRRSRHLREELVAGGEKFGDGASGAGAAGGRDIGMHGAELAGERERGWWPGRRRGVPRGGRQVP